MAETSGRYTVKAKIDENDPLRDELYGFCFWLETNKIAEYFSKFMSKKKYLTEGDLAFIVGIKSELNNPLRFFCGDRDIWRFDLMTYAKDLSERAEKEGSVETTAYKQILKQIQQALED